MTIGKRYTQIFKKAGFEVDVIGLKRIICARNRWKKAFKNQGVLGLNDTRKTNTGRPRMRDFTQEEIIARKDAEIEYLKAEVELLKKLDLRD